MEKSLVEKTKKVIESISKMESIKPYILVGGTALSLQIENRLSEDLDFMRWQTHKGENMDVDIRRIVKELEVFHVIDKTNILESNHVEFYIDGGVKLSFYAPEKRPPVIKMVAYLNNIVLADNALKYSAHAMHSKSLLGKLCNSERFNKDKEFMELKPQLVVSAKEIASFMEEKVQTAYKQKKKIDSDRL